MELSDQFTNMRSTMTKIIATIAITIAATVGLTAGVASADPPSCNWGEATSEAIAAGFEQGPHASSFPTPRVGLANVVAQGDLNATCEAIT